MKLDQFRHFVWPVAAAAALLTLSGCGRVASVEAASTVPAGGEPPRLLNASIHGETAAGDPLPAGTEIKVRVEAPLSSALASAGESIVVKVAAPVSVDGKVRVYAGTEGVLSVVDANAGTQRGSAPSLTLRLRELRFGLVDRAQLHTSPVVIDKTDLAASLASAGSLDAPRGVEIAAGAELTFKLESPATIARLNGR